MGEVLHLWTQAHAPYRSIKQFRTESTPEDRV
jgi:hypothetical protein